MVRRRSASPKAEYGFTCPGAPSGAPGCDNDAEFADAIMKS